MAIQFYLNGVLRDVTEVAPTTTVLDYLREDAVLTGTKEGCLLVLRDHRDHAQEAVGPVAGWRNTTLNRQQEST